MVLSDGLVYFLKIKIFFLLNPPKLSCGFKDTEIINAICVSLQNWECGGGGGLFVFCCINFKFVFCL